MQIAWIVTVSTGHAPILRVARLMLQTNVSGLPIIDARGSAVGIVVAAGLSRRRAEIRVETPADIVPARMRKGPRDSRIPSDSSAAVQNEPGAKEVEGNVQTHSHCNRRFGIVDAGRDARGRLGEGA